VVVDALFEKYFDAADCFEDHARLLATASRYRTAMNIAHDPDKFALELQKCGYSTSPRYGLDLIDLMREFNLYQFDAPPDEPAKALEAA
jgi:flagellar protein FlgJ